MNERADAWSAPRGARRYPDGLAASLAPRGARRYLTGHLRPGGLTGTARCAALPDGPHCGLAASLAPRGARRYLTGPTAAWWPHWHRAVRGAT